MHSSTPKHLGHRLSRRGFVGAAAGAAIAAPAFLRTPRSALAATELDFTVWNYAVDIVQDNINRFQETNPEITVKLSDFVWQAFHETMVNRFISKTPTDVTYNGGNWLNEFAAAGWVVSLDDHFDWAASYQDKVLPFAWQDMTYQRQGLRSSLLRRHHHLHVQREVLEDAGITAPPQTWDEVTEQSLQLKESGMEHPFVYEFANTLPNVSEAFASMVFGRGGELIDEERNPLWTDPESPAAQQLHWLVDAKNEHDILTIMDHETTITKAMNTGQHAFTVMFNYNLAALNNAATSPLAGQFALALMPGETHECYGFAKFYNMTQMAVDRGQEVDRRRRQLHPVLRRRSRRQLSGGQAVGRRAGLGFAQIPLLDDPDVIEAFSAWVDVPLWREQLELARARRQAIWYGIWSESFHPLLGQALAGEITADECLQQSADTWNELKASVEA